MSKFIESEAVDVELDALRDIASVAGSAAAFIEHMPEHRNIMLNNVRQALKALLLRMNNGRD